MKTKNDRGEEIKIGSIVSVEDSHEFKYEWDEKYIVIGMSLCRNDDCLYFCIAYIDDKNDGGADEWKIEDLRLAET